MHAFGDKCEAGDEHVTKIWISVPAAHLISLEFKTSDNFLNTCKPTSNSGNVRPMRDLSESGEMQSLWVAAVTGGMRLTDNSKLLAAVFRGQSEEEVGGVQRQLNPSRDGLSMKAKANPKVILDEDEHQNSPSCPWEHLGVHQNAQQLRVMPLSKGFFV